MPDHHQTKIEGTNTVEGTQATNTVGGTASPNGSVFVTTVIIDPTPANRGNNGDEAATEA